jgi:hypothetical protein
MQESLLTGSQKKIGKNSLMNRIQKKLRLGYENKSKEMSILGNDPFLRYGYGVNAYFELLKTFIYLFTALSILALPMILIYKYYP